MMDKRTTYLLNKINELCSEGSYKIVEQDELLGCFPQKLKMDGDGLGQCLGYLKEHRLIDVKYAEEGVYCLCPLPEGRTYFESVKEQKSDAFRRRRDIVLMTALGAFFGAFIGSVCAWLLTTLIG
ncbi:MAG: hypothetical protein K2L87_01310 [Clostridiales bacterium]|nr:hypothetical protein [Clostridiales bacterium]